MKQYSKEFREQTLELFDEIGLKKVSEQLGVVSFCIPYIG